MSTATGVTADLYGQGLSFPIRIGADGSLVTSAGELNVRECICTILRTAPGERVERPDFGCGVDRMLFENNGIASLQLIQDEVSAAVARWEPRVTVNGVVASVNAADPRDVDVQITYTLIASGVSERLQMTISAQS